MQKKQQQELPNSQNIMATILASIPKEANVTKIDYEGPRFALYTKTPRFLMENNTIISNLVNKIKKRIVIRIVESIRKSEEETRKILNDKVPKEANLQGTFFDTTTGEVSIEVKRPWLCLRNPEFNHAEISEKTGWKLRVRKSTTKPSTTIQAIKYQLKVSSSTGKKPMVAPYSGAILARVARSANFKLFKPGPKNSTNFSTTTFSRSISTTRNTKSVAVVLC